MALPNPTYNNDFAAGVKCPSCRSRNTVAHPSIGDSDYKCEDCENSWDEDSECGTSVVVGLPHSQPDMIRDNIVSVHVEHGVEVGAELAAETRHEEGDVVNIVRLVYAGGYDGRIVGKNAHIKCVGPLQ